MKRNMRKTGSFFAAVVVHLALSWCIFGAEPPATVAVTGDIKDLPTAKQVSDIINTNASVKAVLLVGDTYNGNGTSLEKYKALYENTYGRFWERIHPCPGNHDKVKEDAEPYKAYTEFWKEKAHAPDLYYSFDLAGWHIVSLNCTKLDDSTAAKQLEWLKRDLSGKPGMPVIAFWHYPYLSSARHGGYDPMKKFCEAIYAHGPALIFSGHNHVYERFAPLDPSGQRVDMTTGLQQFVIGPGGSTPSSEQKKDPKPPLPEVFRGDAQHVGFFELFPDGGYRFTVIAIGKDGKQNEVDSGKGNMKAKKD